MAITARLSNNETLRRFEMLEGGQVVFADYRRVGDQLFIDHVESPVDLRGSGAAGRLMSLVAHHARSENLRIVPVCGYAAAWLRRNPIRQGGV